MDGGSLEKFYPTSFCDLLNEQMKDEQSAADSYGQLLTALKKDIDKVLPLTGEIVHDTLAETARNMIQDQLATSQNEEGKHKYHLEQIWKATCRPKSEPVHSKKASDEPYRPDYGTRGLQKKPTK